MTAAPLVPDTRPPSKRDRIMDAALPLFVDRGYFNTTVPDIAEAAGVSVGTIYNYFGNKQDLAATLFVEHIGRYRVEVLSAIHTAGTVEERIRGAVRAILAFIERRPDVARFLFWQRHDEFIDADNPQLRSVTRDELNREMTRFLREGMQTGMVRRIPMQAAVATLVGIPFRYGHLWLEGAYKARPMVMAEHLAESAWQALRAPQNPPA